MSEAEASLRQTWLALPGSDSHRRHALLESVWQAWSAHAPEPVRLNCIAGSLALIGVLETAGIAATARAAVMEVFCTNGERIRVGSTDPVLDPVLGWSGHLVVDVPDWGCIADLTAAQAGAVGASVHGPLLACGQRDTRTTQRSCVTVSDGDVVTYLLDGDNLTWMDALGEQPVHEYVANGLRLAPVVDELLWVRGMERLLP